MMYKHTYTYIHIIYLYIHIYLHLHALHTYIIYNKINTQTHTGTHLHTYPRGWEASLPGKVSLTSSFSSPSVSYYPRLALHKGEGIPFRDAAHHSVLAPLCRYALPHPLPLVEGLRSTDSATLVKL